MKFKTQFMENIWTKVKANLKTIVLPEGNEPRTLKAVDFIKREGLAKIILIGDKENILKTSVDVGVDIKGVKIVNPKNSEKLKEYAEKFYEIRKHKGISIEQAMETMRQEIYYATMMVKMKDADGLVSGAIHSTEEVLKPGMEIIKTSPGISIVSSFFLIEVPNCDLGDNGLFVFGDCVVNPCPNARQLAEIAVCTANSVKCLCGLEPRVAMLSFSTKGSAKHEHVDKVVEATKIAKEMAPDILIDGELQLDAAIIKNVAKIKAKNSLVAGNANVLIFPDLQSGNIAYKLVERLAGAVGIAVLQGFAAPINDLSRGCSTEDIVNSIVLTAFQAIQQMEIRESI